MASSVLKLEMLVSSKKRVVIGLLALDVIVLEARNFTREVPSSFLKLI